MTSKTFVASTLLVCSMFAGAGRAQGPLTLAQAVARALSGNPDLAVDGPGLEAARLEAKAARAAYLPRIDLEQSYTGGNNPVYVFGTLLGQREFTAANFGLPALNTPEPIDNLQTLVLAQQSIWDFGRSRQRVEGARLGVRVSELGRDDHVRQVLLAVIDTYYSAALAREAWDAARAAVESAESIVVQARARVSGGLAVEADLLRGEAFLASTRQREIEARGQREMARSMLNQLMGEALDATPGEPVALAPAEFPVPSEDALRDEQRRRRPDYMRLEAEVRQAELEARARQTDLLPSIGAFAGWEMDHPSLTRAGGQNWSAGVNLRWNVYAGGGDAARRDAARQRLEQKRRQLAAMDSGMALELRQSLVQLRAARQQVDAARSAQAQSEESLRILKNRYDAGLATMTDLLSAESARAAARTAFAEAVYRHRLGYARLEYAAGTLSPTSNAIAQ